MPRRKKTLLTRSTGVALELPVLDYLDRLVANGEAKDRSAVLNIVVREYAKKNGETLPSARIQAEQVQLNLKG
jgi:Arc/MetJ-type ribon-helix-helix transcriptional regulator